MGKKQGPFLNQTYTFNHMKARYVSGATTGNGPHQEKKKKKK